MATIKYKNGSTREFQRVEIDTNGNTVKGYDDYQEVESVASFRVAFVSYGDGKVYLDDDPDW